MGETNIATEWSSDQVTCVLGSFVVDEKGIDDFITIEPDEPDYEVTRGMGGHVIYNATGCKSATLRIRVLQTGKTNKLLSQLRKAGLNAKNGVFFEVSVRDLNGNDLCSGSHCKILGPPTVVFGKSAKDHEWMIHVADMDFDLGGH